VAISGMNHAVLYVRNAGRHRDFYETVLGFETIVSHPDDQFVFMRAPDSDNHHDIAFFSIGEQAGTSAAGKTTVGMYHIAWELGSLPELAQMRDRLTEAGSLVGASDHGISKSLYAADPDGLEFEVMWRVPRDMWGDEEHEAITGPLDLEAELAKFADLSVTPS